MSPARHVRFDGKSPQSVDHPNSPAMPMHEVHPYNQSLLPVLVISTCLEKSIATHYVRPAIERAPGGPYARCHQAAEIQRLRRSACGSPRVSRPHRGGGRVAAHARRAIGTSKWGRSPRSSITPSRSRPRSCSRTCRAIRRACGCSPAPPIRRSGLRSRSGLPVPNNPLDVVRAYRDRMKTHAPIPPRVVAKGAGAGERRSRRRKIDLFKFPVPRLHELDGGRYIGTDDLVIMRDPEENWINAATYRSHGAGQEPRQPLDVARQARPPDPREIFPRRQALPGADQRAATIRCCSSPAATS